jgi:hypothetical protein
MMGMVLVLGLCFVIEIENVENIKNIKNIKNIENIENITIYPTPSITLNHSQYSHQHSPVIPNHQKEPFAMSMHPVKSFTHHIHWFYCSIFLSFYHLLVLSFYHLIIFPQLHNHNPCITTTPITPTTTTKK